MAHAGKAATAFGANPTDLNRAVVPGLFVDRERTGIEVEREHADNMSEPAHRARSPHLAGISPELRTPLHTLLGCIQTLRLDGDLTPLQSRRVDAMLEAGTQLQEKIFAALNISDNESQPSNWRVDEKHADQDVHASRHVAANPHSVAAAATAASEPPRSLRVLIADDIAMNREIAAAFLRAAGHAVAMVEGGDDAVAGAAAEDFDVILMDVRMPGTDGLEAARQIRALPGARRHTPIVALTALAFSDEVEACRMAGMNAHLAKPFCFDTLNDAILRVLGGPPASHARE